MPKVEFPLGLDGAENLPETRTALENCFNNGQGQILPRPGITQLGTNQANLARGSFTWNGGLYFVFGTALLKVTDILTGTVANIGTIAGSSVIKVAIGFNEVVIMAKDFALYALDKMDFLTDITNNQNFLPVTDLANIDGRFVYIPTDGSPAFFSDVGVASTVQPLSFFDAEELPDLNNAVFNFANTLYIGGTDSFELFRDVGTTPNPFARISGARHRYGFIGALLEYTNSFLFLGREKDQDFGFYAIGPGQTAKISNAFIDKVLTNYAPEELAECVPGRIKWRGYDIATFTLARDSFGFYQGNWFKLSTLVGGFPRPWLGGYITQFNGKYYTASVRSVGRFDETNTDFNDRIAKTIDLGFKHPNNEKFSCQCVEFGISQGFNDAVGTVGLFISRDNRLYGPAIYRSLGALGQYNHKLSWNPSGGMGNYDGFMGIRIYTTGDLVFAADSLYLNIRG
jgi:hypothetical protein